MEQKNYAEAFPFCAESGIMKQGGSPANLDNVNSAHTSVQADREFMTTKGCHVKVFYRQKADPSIRREVARLLLEAFEAGKER